MSVSESLPRPSPEASAPSGGTKSEPSDVVAGASATASAATSARTPPPARRSGSAPPEVDPITLEVVCEGLIAIVREMRATIIRSSFSSVIYEFDDFSCALFGPGGEMVAQSWDHPGHVLPLPWGVRCMFEDFADDLHPGDVVLLNDPYRGGTHLNDVTLVHPIFDEDGNILVFPAVRAHWVDVGGMVPGSYSGLSTNIYQEGGADPAHQDPRAREGQPRRDGPAHGQHASPRGARRRLQCLARRVPGRRAADPPGLRALRDRHGSRRDPDQPRPHGASPPGADRRAPGRELLLRGLPRVLRGGPARPGARAARAHRRRRRHRGRLRGLEPPGPRGGELVARGDRGGRVRGGQVHPGPGRGGERRRVPAHRAAGAGGERGGRPKRRSGRRARRGAQARRVGGARRAGADHPRAGVGGSVRHVVPELHRRLEPPARAAVRLLRGAGRGERGFRGGGRIERVRQRRLRQHPHHPDRGIDRERDAAAGGAVRAASRFGRRRRCNEAGSACTARFGCWARRGATRC